MATRARLEPDAALTELSQMFPEAPIGELEGYLRLRKRDVAAATAQYKSTLAWRAAFKPPTILEVAPFCRTPEGQSGPDGCLVLLEDGKGDCARDLTGRPIIAALGMMYGTVKEMQQQLVYVCNRAKQYMAPGQPHESTVVIEVKPREGAAVTFRFPDKVCREAGMDLSRQHFPSHAVGDTTHFCGLPRAVTWGFKLCKPFMAKATYENMVLRPNFSHLTKRIAPGQLLKEWGGEREFDMEAYIAWRAAEEGLADQLPPLSDPAAARQFNPSSPYADADGVSGDAAKEENPLLEISSKALSALEGVRKIAAVYKRGSGTGLFASSKWKQKLLVAMTGSLVYFNSTDIDEANTVSRFLNLAGAYAEAVRSEHKAPSAATFLFQVVAPARTFLFACKSEEELEAWLTAIRSEIKFAADVAAGRDPTVETAPAPTDSGGAAGSGKSKAVGGQGLLVKLESTKKVAL